MLRPIITTAHTPATRAAYRCHPVHERSTTTPAISNPTAVRATPSPKIHPTTCGGESVNRRARLGNAARSAGKRTTLPTPENVAPLRAASHGSARTKAQSPEQDRGWSSVLAVATRLEGDGLDM